MRQITYKYYLILSILFAATTALGQLNVLNPYGTSSPEGDGQSSPFTLAVQGVFILSLIFIRDRIKHLGKFIAPLICFSVLFLLSSIINANHIPVSFYIQMCKLIACIYLFYKLPSLYLRYPKLFYISILSYAFAIIIISLLFSFDLLGPLVSWHGGRAWLFFENPNSTSSRAALAVLFIIIFVETHKTKVSKILYLCCLPIFYLIFAGGSRGSFIILILSIVLYILLRNRNVIKMAFKIASGICIGIVLITYLSEIAPEATMMTRISESIETGDTAGRELLIEYTEIIFEKSPILGVGAITFTDLMRVMFNEHRTVHNMFWYVLVTTGMVGFTCFMIFVYNLLKTSWRNLRKVPISFVIIVAMLLLGYKTGGALTYINMWFGFAVALSYIYFRHTRQNENHIYIQSKRKPSGWA